MQAINSPYPVWLDCGYTSSDVTRAFSAKEQIDLFHRAAAASARFAPSFRALSLFPPQLVRQLRKTAAPVHAHWRGSGSSSGGTLVGDLVAAETRGTRMIVDLVEIHTAHWQGGWAGGGGGGMTHTVFADSVSVCTKHCV